MKQYIYYISDNNVLFRSTKYGKGDAHFVYKYPERKWSIIKHLLINYPFVKSYRAALNGKIKYIPFFVLVGLVRFVYFLPEYYSLKKSKIK